MYTTQDRVEAYLNRDLTDYETLFIDDVIEHISSYIDSYTNRHWLSVDSDEDDEDDLEATTRIFSGNGKKDLIVDDFIGLEKVRMLNSQGDEINLLELDEANPELNWLLTPSNTNPKESIRLRNTHFPYGLSNIEVTAIWGSGKPPATVVIAATNLVGKYLTKTASSSGSFKRESIEGYSYELIDAASVDADTTRLLEMLDKHKKYIL
jgi:hypothetical protein